MNVLQQLISDEIDRRKDVVADADQRLVDARKQLQEALANAQRAHAEIDQLTTALQAAALEAAQTAQAALQ